MIDSFRPRLGVSAKALSGLIVLLATGGGCPATKPGTCVPATAGCTCAPNGLCDPGLSCSSGVCSPGGGGNGGAAPIGGAGGTTPPPSTGDELSPRTFVFNKLIRRGSTPSSVSNQVFPNYFRHLYAYDLTTRTERSITNYDDEGKTEVGGGVLHAVSPDRQWIAFYSTKFRRPAEEDVTTGVRSGAIWAVSASGQNFKRLSPPLGDDIQNGAPCASDRGCPVHRQCATGFCRAVDLDLHFGPLLWSRDGSTIYFEESWRSVCQAGVTDIRLCFFGSVRWLTNSIFDRSASPDDAVRCSSSRPLALHPQLNQLLVFRHDCFRGTAGFHQWAVAPDGKPSEARFLQQALPFLRPPATAAWLPDGSTLVIAAGQTEKPRSTTPGDIRQRYRGGVHTWTEAGGFQKLYEPTDDSDVVALTVSPAGDVVVEVQSGEPVVSQLHLFDLAARKLGEQLTRDGSNAAPAF